MTITRRATAVLALSAIAGLGLTACDNGPKPVDDKSGSARTDKGGQTDKGGKGGAKQASAKLTAEDFSERMAKAQEQAGSVHLEMKIETMGMTMPMSADMVLPEDNDPNDVKMRMTMDMSAVAGMGGTGSEEVPDSMEMIMIGTKEIYMKMGSLTQEKYAKMSQDQLQTMNLDQSMNGSDPAAQAELMKKYLKEFKENGTETIDGVETTRYDVTVDTEMLTEQAESQGEDSASAAAGVFGDELVYKMWIGEDDLPRKMAFDMGTSGSTEMTFSKWGEDLEISAPPADQITEGLPGF
ncbi:MAG: hypothetical protein ACTIJJ_01640 [Galactobacter sp.]|uniref:hypothetical protein n=1 Tax=Galactobacter sp. TaxID=2676125 RepID=UPI0025BB2CAE|nr:hypothetical protein [Galactobacter sp.]